MILEMIKFGNILNSRPAGREAALRAKQIINGSANSGGIVLDFTTVEVLTPSFADEFVTGLKEFYPNVEIKFQGFDNQVIGDTLRDLQFIS